jgi:phytoene desaturase
MRKAIVIGAGIGGLASAIRLSKMGYAVKVFEKNDRVGGKISEITDQGYRFDTGPSLFTLPGLVEGLFSLCGENATDYLKYSRIDPICQYFFADGKVLNAYADAQKFADEMEDKMGEPADGIMKYLKKYADLYNDTAQVFLFNSFHRLKNFIKPEFKKTLFKLHKLDSLTTMHKRNNATFKTQYATQLFNRYATYNGSNPYETPATLNMISHLEHNLGAFFPEKGMYEIANALFELANRQKVEFYFNSDVEQVLYANSKVKGILVNSRIFDADVVISNADAATFYEKLLPLEKAPKSVTKHELSSSGVIFYWGIKKQFPELDLHNILFSANYKDEFEALFKKKTIYYDPTVYVFISSKKVKADAKEGCENWFVMVNSPANYGQNWEEMITEVRKNIVKKINKRLNTTIEEFIEVEHVANPLTIEQQTSSFKGALYGNSSNSIMAAFNRHPNFSRKFKNLYFAGGSVHPGGGIPLCLSSAKIACELVQTDHN